MRSLPVVKPCVSGWTCMLLVREEGRTAQDASSGTASPIQTRTRKISSLNAVTRNERLPDWAMKPSRAVVNCCAFALQLKKTAIDNKAMQARHGAGRNIFLLIESSRGRVRGKSRHTRFIQGHAIFVDAS